MEAAPGAPAFVKLSAVVQHTMERAYGALVAVMDSAASKNDRERKQLLYEWFVRTRASVIRLLVVLKWARTVPDINHTRDILSFLATEDGLFVSTADNLYTLHQRLQLVKVPIYDVPTAIDVLSTGSYTRLPTSIAAVAGPLVLAAPKEVELKRRVEDMLHYRMFFSFTPPQYSDIRIESDRVVLSVVDEFKASLTADGESLDKYPWRVLDVSVYVGQESDGPVALPPPVLAFVKELLASRLPGAAQPLLELYSILHSFCLSLQLELLSSQTAQMVRGPWQDALWPVYTKDLSLCLYFWTPPPKSGAPADDATYVQVRMDADRALLVSLSPPAPLADPIRLPRPLQAERLLLSAIAAQSLQKLNTLRASLLADAELALKPADASLTTNQSAAGTWHTLVIGLGLDKRFTVGVDGKTGRFVGHMPALADLTTIAPNVNELLNRSPQAAALLIGTLMQQTLLDVFAHLISVYYSSELARVPSLLVEGYELPARALVHRYTDVEHSFIVIDVNKRGRVACTALTTTPVEGGARPLKKVEELSSELDLRDASLSLHERCRRALASAIAAAQWARASRQVLTRFLEARGVRYSVAAPDRVVLPSLAEAEAFMPRLISFAAVEGLWELRVTEGERLLRRPRVEGGNGMRYHGGMWTFPLARLSLPALDELLKSVRGFGRLLRVAALLEGALDAANNAVLGSQFRGPVVYSTSVQLQHVGSDIESTISISYRDDRYALSFGDTQHPLLAFFQAQLNSPVCDARALLEAIDQSLAPCRLLLAFVQPRERTPSAPVPGDFTLVPHHSSQVRLVYRGVFGVDISFLPGRTVAVEDAVKPAMRVVATTLAPVSQLSALLERHATKVNNRFVVPWASLPQALHALYRMVGVQLFLRRTQQLLGDVDPPAKADVQTTRCRLSLRSGQALFLYLHDVSQLEVAASVPGVPPSAPVADALSAEEVDALAVFSRTHVACEPFRLSHFASFLHLLLLPTDSLRQFVRLLAAIDRKDVALSLHLALPPLPLPAPAHASSAVVADKATGEVRFAVRLHPGTPHELDAFLRWTPSAARLSSWLPDRALELSVAPGSPLLEQLRALAALPHEARKAALQRQ